MPYILEKIEKYDIVTSKKMKRIIAGKMTSFNRHATKAFDGFALVLGASESFCAIYSIKTGKLLVRKEDLKIALKFKKNKKCKF